MTLRIHDTHYNKTTIMLSVTMLSVIMMNVMAPLRMPGETLKIKFIMMIRQYCMVLVSSDQYWLL